METSIYIYFIFLCLVIGIMEYQYIKSVKFIDFLLVIVFIILVSFRPETVRDTQPYIDYYKSITNNQIAIPSIRSLEWEGEFGYVFLNQACKLFFGENYRFLFIIITLINVTLIYFSSKIIINLAFRESFEFDRKLGRNTILAKKMSTILLAPLFALYISYYGLMYNAIVLRAGLALSFLIFAYSKVTIGKYLQGIILLAASILFHKTAVIGILFLLIGRYSFGFTKNKYYIIWFILMIIYLSSIGNTLSEYVSTKITPLLLSTHAQTSLLFGNYLDQQTFHSRYSYMTIVNLLNILVCIKYFQNIQIFKTLLNIALFGIFLQVIFGAINVFNRITDYFLFTNFIMYYLVILKIKKGIFKYAFFSWIIITNSIFFWRLSGL